MVVDVGTVVENESMVDCDDELVVVDTDASVVTDMGLSVTDGVVETRDSAAADVESAGDSVVIALVVC